MKFEEADSLFLVFNDDYDLVGYISKENNTFKSDSYISLVELLSVAKFIASRDKTVYFGKGKCIDD